MTGIEKIEEAVAHLPQEQLREFSAWFDAFLADAWDRQLSADVQGGALDALGDEAAVDSEAGRCTRL